MSDPRPPHPASKPLAGLRGAMGGKPAEGGPMENPEWNKDIKAYYDAIASEPIPDEIQQLMATLAKAIRK